MPKTQLPKAGPTVLCWDGSRVLHNFFSYYSYHPSLTFSVSLSSKIFHYKNIHYCNQKQAAGEKGGISCPWGSRRRDCSCRLDLRVSSLCCLRGFTLTHCRKPDHWYKLWLHTPRPALEGFIVSFEEATSHWWFQVLQLPSALSLPPPPNIHRKINTKALPKPNLHRLLPSKPSSGNCWGRQHSTCFSAKIQVCNN